MNDKKAKKRTDGVRDAVKRSATAGRLKRLVVRRGFLCALFLSVSAGCFSADGRAACFFAVLFSIVAVASAWGLCYCLRLLISFRRIRAEEWALARTVSAWFECFGPFLAMNVEYEDGKGGTREGRTRFIFGARDAEAWQNASLTVAYRKRDGGDGRIVLIGTAEKTDKEKQNGR